MNRLINSKHRQNKQQGFTLLELLIAVVIASISVLGLAYTQTKSLQYARSSSQYTRASIEATNTVEQIWGSLCEFQNGTKALNALTLADGFTRTFTPTSFDNEMTITIDWADNRLTDVDNNVSVQVVFPNISADTTLCP
ncbi:prepilin-type N-terminal cleavage/methylation domain-containing protein [Psychromonas sp. SP041]|uniref:type IV pilus modification PilV family protein n=1 Tax=Psychromonas sp. SP041 TaxID=1365007 RepID=UPI00040A269E|nr:prepilin-type N-terminal cleavage/methylation domain-containing protein [Psychromonas sp. SP041]